MKLPDFLYVLLELLDAAIYMDWIYVSVLELGIENVHVWHYPMKQFKEEVEIRILQ